MVNAPVVAKERGIKVSETRRGQQGVYEGYIKITVTLGDGSTRRVAGTVFSDGRPRLIQIKDINLDAEFAPHMLYVVNEDKPGFIGKLGTLAGRRQGQYRQLHPGPQRPGPGRHRLDWRLTAGAGKCSAERWQSCRWCARPGLWLS